MKKIYHIALFFLSIWSVDSFAVIKTTTCNGCTAASMEHRAELQGAPAYGQNWVFVMNFYDHVSKKYSVYKERDKWGEINRYVTEESLTSAEEDAVNNLYLYREKLVEILEEAKNKPIFIEDSNQITNSFNKITDSSPTKLNAATTVPTEKSQHYAWTIGVKGDPYFFLSHSEFRNNVYDYYFTRNSSVLTALLAKATDLIEIPNVIDMGVYIEVQFYSDSEATKENGFVSVNLDLVSKTLVVLGGRDGDNNSLILQANKLFGDGLKFTGKNQQSWENYAYHLLRSSGNIHYETCRLVVVNTEKKGNIFYYTYACKKN